MKPQLICLIVSLTLLAAITACGGGDSSDNDDYFETSGFKDCDNLSLMTTSPISFNDLIAIRPLGTLNPPDHTQPTRHTYWYAGDPGNPPTSEELAEVVSPGDIRLFEISETTYSNRSYESDYTMHFFICNQVSGYFNHLSELDSDFASQIGDFSQGSCDSYSTSSETVSNCTLQIELDIPAATPIGIVSYFGTLDFGMDDSRVTNTMASTERFEFIKHAVCPMNYFVGSEKEALLNITGEYDGSVQRIIEPRCGKVDFDIEGTASGAWV
mgnify:CR=1 FL=1